MENEVITKDLLVVVFNEAVKLRKYATQAELEKLSFENLLYYDYQKCIYGQMTGDCWNERAIELLSKCAISCAENSMVNIIPKSKRKKITKMYRDLKWAFSGIEVFIANSSDKDNNTLISFLKTGDEVVFKNHFSAFEL